jgi:hypothetical protein
MICKILDLVSGVDVDAMTEITCFQLLGPGARPAWPVLRRWQWWG